MHIYLGETLLQNGFSKEGHSNISYTIYSPGTLPFSDKRWNLCSLPLSIGGSWQLLWLILCYGNDIMWIPRLGHQNVLSSQDTCSWNPTLCCEEPEAISREVHGKDHWRSQPTAPAALSSNNQHRLTSQEKEPLWQWIFQAWAKQPGLIPHEARTELFLVRPALIADSWVK